MAGRYSGGPGNTAARADEILPSEIYTAPWSDNKTSDWHSFSSLDSYLDSSINQKKDFGCRNVLISFSGSLKKSTGD